jgi:DNA repair protein RadC
MSIYTIFFMKIKEMNNSLRPRERLRYYGAESLSDAELLALVLKVGTPGENVLDISRNILSEFELDSFFALSFAQLVQQKSIGTAKACQIQAISEIFRRIRLSRAEQKKFSHAKDVFEYASHIIGDKKEEHFLILHLTTQNRLISYKILSKGILDAALIHPREVFRSAIEHSAYACIISHNHPSGDATPSNADSEVTEILMKTGEIVGIPILDHVVIGKNNYYSFSEKILKRSNK